MRKENIEDFDTYDSFDDYEDFKDTNPSDADQTHVWRSGDLYKDTDNHFNDPSSEASKRDRASDAGKDARRKTTSQRSNKKSDDSSSRKKKKRSGSAKVVKNVGKTGGKVGSKVIKTGGKAAFKTVKLIFRLATLILIAAIMALIAINFIKAFPTYGSISTLVSERNYTLAGFLCVGAALLVFEGLSFLFAMTGPHGRVDGHRKSMDTGRGLFSFIVIAFGTIASSLLGSYVPEVHAVVTGAKQGILLFGSMSMPLLGLCVAGAVSCIIRKILS